MLSILLSQSRVECSMMYSNHGFDGARKTKHLFKERGGCAKCLCTKILQEAMKQVAKILSY